ncbi:MAG: hypothetical protein JXA04_10990 [Gammaproteobacteria bacterium]|nr:hypothetical protein [Gammaproteobacteria bacterium]
MKAGINKEQALEIRRWLEKQRVPKDAIDVLLSSQHASNTHKAFRMKKQINTPDGTWAIHFGANWARPVENVPEPVVGSGIATDVSARPAPAAPALKPKKDIKTIGEDFLSRTFMGLAEKLKRLQVEDVDKPTMQKIALEVDKDHLAILKKASAEKDTTVGNLIRIAIRDYIENH